MSDRTQYFLKTRRLGFRLWTEADLDLARGLWGNVEITGLIGGPFSEEQIKERLASEISTMRTHQVQYWPIFYLSNGEHVGCCGLRPYRLEDRVYEIGVHLRPSYQRQGLALEACRPVITFAFDKIDATALFAGHHPMNESSRRLLQKLGFEYTHDEYYPPTRLHHPSYLLTRTEWMSDR